MKKTVRDIEVKGKRALVRCDFNVPLKDGVITDDIRIVSALPTIRYLMENGARVILMSHLGRPDGEPKKEFTLAPVAERLSRLLGTEVKFAGSDNVIDDKVREAASELKDGEVMLLENVRFRKEDEERIRAAAGDSLNGFIVQCVLDRVREHEQTAEDHAEYEKCPFMD